ncbi:MAG: NAD-dependent epimerase/dehydratase family protein [Proteobacteria bacterium]|nr:NAD-dependent epimerase/dehydratase family protein [Pseudomonadota bacterium]
MPVLVTGATGFVGAALTRRLVADGREVHVLVRDAQSAALPDLAKAAVHLGSLADPNQLAQAASGCEALIHCAAECSSLASNQTLGWTNVAGTENVLRAARHSGCQRLVMVSCADVTLINAPRVHWSENRKLSEQPAGLHARSKLLAEELALCASSKTLGVTALRPAILWGPGDNHLLPELCRTARHNGMSLAGSGRNLVSTTYIDNLVHAIIATLAAAPQAVEGKAYYITDDEFLESAEFFGMLCESAGLPLPRRGSYLIAYAGACVRQWLLKDPASRAEVIRRGRSYHFDIGASLTDFGYRPQTSVGDGMRAVHAWVNEVGGPEIVARRLRSVPVEPQ